MRRIKRSRKGFLFVSFCLMMALLASCSSGSTPSADSDDGDSGNEAVKFPTMTLKGMTAWPESDNNSKGFFFFVDKVKELSDGAITIEYTGGPESIPPFDQGEAVRNGVADLAWLATSYYSNAMPEATVFLYTDLTWDEMRSNGALDFINEIQHEKMNSHMLGGAPGFIYYLYTNKPVTSMEDIKGARIRATGSYIAFTKALGAEPVSTTAGEMYEAMEKGVIDGLIYPFGVTELSLEEQIKYKILPSFYSSTVASIINYDKWESFSPEVQDLFIEAAKATEAYVQNSSLEYLRQEDEKLKAAGVQIVEIKESDEYRELAYEAGWEDLKEQTGENAQKLEELFR